jgi:hypothetical protein
MCVAGEQNERMLQNESRDPHIVGRNGSALLSHLPVNSTVIMSSLFIGVEHANPGLQQETAENTFIPRSLSTDSEFSA